MSLPELDVQVFEKGPYLTMEFLPRDVAEKLRNAMRTASAESRFLTGGPYPAAVVLRKSDLNVIQVRPPAAWDSL